MSLFSRFTFSALASVSVLSPLQAGELPPELQAKFIKIICSSAGGLGSVACKDPLVGEEIAKLGMKVDATSKVAWASKNGDVKEFKNAGKLVVCSRLDFLSSGGSIAVVEEGGKPAVYLHMSNIGASGVTLSDAILKIGRRM
jgi:hypothetical protein